MIPGGRKTADMSVVVVATALPIPEHHAEVVTALEEAIARVHDEPGVELYTPHEGAGRLVMTGKCDSSQAPPEHAKGAAPADVRSALQRKPSGGLDPQVLVPHPAGNARKGALRAHAGNPSTESSSTRGKGHRS
jgi:quinol monooxygenase YgiN